MPKNYIACDKLSYNLPNNETLFSSISFSISYGEKSALIGDNGIGKTTLIKLIAGILVPYTGTIENQAKIYYVEQDLNSIKGEIIKSTNFGKKLIALNNINNGLAMEQDWQIIGQDWDIEERLIKELEDWGLRGLDLSSRFELLSGGEKEKILIIDALLTDADIVILDEPTNNLDTDSKKLLYEKILQSSKGFFIITHDRNLLKKLDVIFEMSSNKIEKYGGNYDFYLKEKQRYKDSLESKLREASSNIKKLKTKQQELIEKKDRKNKYGEKQIANSRYMKIQANAMKSASDKTFTKKKNDLSQKINQQHSQIYELGLKLVDDTIKIPLPEKPFIKDKLFEIEELYFSYTDNDIIKNFNLIMKGNDRFALCGKNGSGKTTLIKILIGEIKDYKGFVKLNGRAVYLDQNLSILDSEKSLLDNIMNINKGITINDAYKTLANFKFRNVLAQKIVKNLSGGELLRGCLAAIFCTSHQPDLIILDEPTNNLDIKSVRILEESLAQYQGGLLVISHDEEFLSNININKKIFF